MSRSPERGEIALTAVICTYNRYDLLPEAIELLLKQDVPADLFEIIVVDNSADQAAATRFGGRYAGLSNLTYLVETKPGLSNARNRGTAAAVGRVVAFIDDDARACPSWAKGLLHAHTAFEGRAGIVGGPIVPRWIDEKPTWIGEPMLGYLTVIDLGHELRELSAGEWLAGCNISFDRVSLIAAGGFSTRLGRMGSESNASVERGDRGERAREGDGQTRNLYAQSCSRACDLAGAANAELVSPSGRVAGGLRLTKRTGTCARPRSDSVATPVATALRGLAIWHFAKCRGTQARYGPRLQRCDCRPLWWCRACRVARPRQFPAYPCCEHDPPALPPPPRLGLC